MVAGLGAIATILARCSSSIHLPLVRELSAQLPLLLSVLGIVLACSFKLAKSFILLFLLERSSKSVPASQSPDSTFWNISVVSQVLLILQHLVLLESRLLVSTISSESEGAPNSPSSSSESESSVVTSRPATLKCIVPLVALLLESGSAIEQRKLVLRVFRALPRHLLASGLSQLALRSSKGSKVSSNLPPPCLYSFSHVCF